MSLEADAQMLARLPLFEELEHEALRLLAFQASKLQFDDQSEIFQKGSIAEGGYIVLSGSVGLFSDKERNNPDYIVKPGILIGKIALITEVAHQSHAKALEQTALLKITRPSFQKVLQEFPGGAAKIRAKLAADLSTMTHSLARSHN